MSEIIYEDFFGGATVLLRNFDGALKYYDTVQHDHSICEVLDRKSP